MSVNRTLVRQVLASSAQQLEPSLTNLERALGRPLDAVSFAMGMLTTTLVMGRTDVVHAVAAMPEEFAEFVTALERREARDLGPYVPGELVSGYYHGALKFDPGTPVQFRRVDDRFAEVMFPPFDGFVVRWLESAQVEAKR